MLTEIYPTGGGAPWWLGQPIDAGELIRYWSLALVAALLLYCFRLCYFALADELGRMADAAAEANQPPRHAPFSFPTLRRRS